MTYKNKIKVFFTCVLVAFFILPVINNLNLEKEFNLDTIEKEFNLDTIEKYVNFVTYKTFNRSLNQKQVITGKDNFLFLGNQYNQVLHQTNGTKKTLQSDIEKITYNLKSLQDWYEKREIKFVLVVAPNKHSVYKDKLPKWMEYSGKTTTNRIIDSAKKMNVNILDLTIILNKEKLKNDDLLYFKTDTHWNDKAAAIGYEETINYLNQKYKLEINKPKYNFTRSYTYPGDLSRFLKINEILGNKYEETPYIKLKKNIQICIGEIVIESGKMKNCRKTWNGITAYNKNMYIKNEFKKNGTLLFLGDSSSKANSLLYNASFDTIWKFPWWNGNKLTHFFKEHKPDIVIYQVIERRLSGFVKTIPQAIVNYN